MRRYNWRSGPLGWFLNIHSPSAHAMETCWCIGTKRELVLPDTFMTRSRAMAELEASYAYLMFMDTILSKDCMDATCNYLEPHKHGFACDVACQICSESKR